MYSVYFVDKID